MLYYDREGQPMGLWDWESKFMDWDYHVVKKTTVWEGDEFSPIVEVSTVWLGINHNWGGGPPHIFETMVFGGKLDEQLWRYATEADAIVGHQEVVKLVKMDLEVDGL